MRLTQMRFTVSLVLTGFLASTGWGQFTDDAGGVGTQTTNGTQTNAGGGSTFGGGGNIAGGGEVGGTSDNVSATFGETDNDQNRGFIGQNLNSQQGQFLGGNQALQQQAGGGQFGNAGGFGNQGRGQQFGRGQGLQPQRARTTRVIRTKITVAFDFPNVPEATLRNNLETQFQSINRAQERSRVALGLSRVFRDANISVSASGRTVTLRGTVGSEREKDLAARIAKLEPGVDEVKNELGVTQ